MCHVTEHGTPDQQAGAKLKELRDDLRLTQQEVADRAGINRSRYNALERGRVAITMTYATRLAPILKLEDPSLLLPPQQPAQHGGTLSEKLDEALLNQATAVGLLEELQAAVRDGAAASRANGRRMDRLDQSLVELRKTLEPQRRTRGSA